MTEAMFKLVVTDPVDPPPGRVYLEYYQLSEAPFAITPDPGFLFSSTCHQQVLDKISYAIDSRMGFVLLTGEVGTGKTTLCRTLLDRLGRQADTVYVINPSVSGHELLASILEDLGDIPEPNATKKALIDRLNQRLLYNCTDRPFVVIIDDAQTMTPEALEDLRLLSNLETDKRKLIQVILAGQPELLEMLADDRLRQLKQRIAVYCRLEPLSVRETGEYISRRLFVAGNKGQVHFSPAAAQRIHKTAGGIPRQINKICDYALTAGYVNDAPAIDPIHVKGALAELDGLDGRRPHNGRRAMRYGVPAAMVVALLIAAAVFILRAGSLPPEASIRQHRPEIDNPVRAKAAPPEGRDDAISPAEPSETIQLPPSATTGKTDAGKRREPDNTTASSERGRTGRDGSSAGTLALQLGSFRSLESARRGAAGYRKKGVPAHWQMREDDLMETGMPGDNRINTGLFISVEDAATTAERINSDGRLLAEVVSRQTHSGQPEADQEPIS